MNIPFCCFVLIFNACFCIVYVDLENYIISEGVLSFLGHAKEGYTYVMLVGENEPIDIIKYGDEKIFPAQGDIKYEHILNIEVFDMRSKKFAIVNLLCFDNKYQEKVHRVKFEFAKNEWNRVSYFTTNIYKFFIYLSIDINENVKKHPFFKISEQQIQNIKEVKYTLIDKFKDIKLDGNFAPMYRIGSVYDSLNSVVVGFTVFDKIIDSCRIVTLKYREDFCNLDVTTDKAVFEYIKVKIRNMYFWSYSGNPKLLTCTEKKAGLGGKAGLSRLRQPIDSIFLDIRERISPEYYGIAKLTGYTNLHGYTLYESKPNSPSIKCVIFSTINKPKIYVSENNEMILSVEVFVDHLNIYVIVNIEKIYSKKKIKRKEIFHRIGDGFRFIRFDEEKLDEEYEKFKKLYPINLNIDIDEQPVSVYERVEINDDMFNFNYFYLNECDSFGQDLLSKYKFGSLSEVNPYIFGNIPVDKYKKHYRIIRPEVNTHEFLIRNPYNQKPIDPSHYEIYVPVA